MKGLKFWFFLTIFLLLPVMTLADSVSGDWQYILNDEGRVVITGYNAATRDINMPWNLDGRIIAEIGESAFAGNTALRSIQLPVGVTIIRMEAFKGCTQLEEIILPSLLETIEDGAFTGCTSLALVEIPDSVAEMGDNVFASNTALTGSENSLAADYAAAYGLKCTSAAQPVEEEYDYSKDYQYEIRNGGVVITSYIGQDYEVYVPAEIDGYPVRVIGTNAFSSRYEVEHVVLPEGLVELERTAFRKCPSLSSIEFPSSLVSIGDNAFYQCENLREIVLPAGLVTLGDRAFTGCTQLRSVTIYADLQGLRNYTFYDCHPTLTIYAPKGSAAEQHAYSRGYRFVPIDN